MTLEPATNCLTAYHHQKKSDVGTECCFPQFRVFWGVPLTSEPKTFRPAVFHHSFKAKRYPRHTNNGRESRAYVKAMYSGKPYGRHAARRRRPWESSIGHMGILQLLSRVSCPLSRRLPSFGLPCARGDQAEASTLRWSMYGVLARLVEAVNT